MSLVKTPHVVAVDRPTSRCRRPAVVIADSGVSASLVLLCGMADPVLGQRFQHAGLTWEVTGWRPAARAFVAEPVAQ